MNEYRLSMPSPSRPSMHSPSLMVVRKRMLRISFQLYIPGHDSVGDDFHTLFSLIRCIAAVTCVVVVIVVEDDNFAECIFNLVTLFAGLISPLLELGERDMFNLLTGFRPGTSLEHLVVVCVCVTNVCHNSKLYSASKREFRCITYSVCALSLVSMLGFPSNVWIIPLRRHGSRWMINLLREFWGTSRAQRQICGPWTPLRLPEHRATLVSLSNSGLVARSNFPYP